MSTKLNEGVKKLFKQAVRKRGGFLRYCQPSKASQTDTYTDRIAYSSKWMKEREEIHTTFKAASAVVFVFSGQIFIISKLTFPSYHNHI